MAGRATTPAGKRRAQARTSRAASGGRKPTGRSGGGATRKPPARKPPARPPAKRGSATPRKRGKHAPPRQGGSRRGNGTAHARTKQSAKGRRPAKRTSGRRRLSLRTSLIVVAVLAIAGTAAYFAWFRNSSLVAVEQVRVRGLATSDADKVTAALEDAAKGMTTLNFDEAELRAAVKPFPTVAAVSADTNFPTGVDIEVTPRTPAMLVNSGDEFVPVAGDGTLLRGLDIGETRDSLPAIDVREIPPGPKLGGEPLALATVAGATPPELRPLIERIDYDDEIGVEVTMRGDIPIQFGTPASAAEKWAAAAAVLADPRLDTLTYVDVRVPERPAVGGAGPAPEEEEAPVTDPAVVPTDTATPVVPETTTP
jgi:cell division septal protein FtsQ